MDLNQLRALGAFKNREIVPRTVTMKHKPLLPETDWPDSGIPAYSEAVVENTVDTFIRTQTAADTIELSRCEERFLPALMVLRCVVNEKGEQVFPDLDTVLSLQEWVLVPLYMAVAEVNAFAPKRSPSRTSSGANSRSGSGAGPSRNGRKFSRQKNSRPGRNIAASTAPSAPSGASTATSESLPSSSPKPAD